MPHNRGHGGTPPNAGSYGALSAPLVGPTRHENNPMGRDPIKIVALFHAPPPKKIGGPGYFRLTRTFKLHYYLRPSVSDGENGGGIMVRLFVAAALVFLAAAPVSAQNCIRNPLGGVSCDDGSYSRRNPMGGMDYSDGTTSRRNPLGGMDYSDGTTSRRNPLGGMDHSSGVTSRPNPFGGMDYSNGMTCRPNLLGGMDCQ